MVINASTEVAPFNLVLLLRPANPAATGGVDDIRRNSWTTKEDWVLNMASTSELVKRELNQTIKLGNCSRGLYLALFSRRYGEGQVGGSQGGSIYDSRSLYAYVRYPSGRSSLTRQQ